MTFLLHLRLLSMQHEDQTQLAHKPAVVSKTLWNWRHVRNIHYVWELLLVLLLNVDDDDVIGRYACVVYVRVRKDEKRKRNNQNDERKRQSAYWCYYALQWFHLYISFVRSFVCSVDGHIDFFVCGFIQWIFHIRTKKHLILLLLPCTLIYVSVFFFFSILQLKAHWRVTFEHNLTFYAHCDMYMIRKISEMMIEIIGSLGRLINKV